MEVSLSRLSRWLSAGEISGTGIGLTTFDTEVIVAGYTTNLEPFSSVHVSSEEVGEAAVRRGGEIILDAEAIYRAEAGRFEGTKSTVLNCLAG